MTTRLNISSQMRFRTIDGLTVRFARSEDRGDDALLLSPWPESLPAFEPVWARLAEQAHLVAIDLPGPGHSQRRDALLSPRAMGGFVIRAADAFGLGNPHVVGPGASTAAALFAAAAHPGRPPTPGRLRSLVVGSGGSAVPLQLGGGSGMTAMIGGSSPGVRGKAGPPVRSAGYEAWATVLPATGRALGPEHPVTLQTRANLGYWAAQPKKTSRGAVQQLPARINNPTLRPRSQEVGYRLIARESTGNAERAAAFGTESPQD